MCLLIVQTKMSAWLCSRGGTRRFLTAEHKISDKAAITLGFNEKMAPQKQSQKSEGIKAMEAKSGWGILVTYYSTNFLPFSLFDAHHEAKSPHFMFFFCHSSSATPSLSSAWLPLYMLSMSDPAVTTNYLEGLQASLLILTTALFLLKA